MKFIFKFSALLFCLQISLSFAGTPAAEKIHELSPADTQKVREVVIEVRKAILNKNTNEFLKHISATNGLTCTDIDYTHKEVKKFLSNNDSQLYISLFSTVNFLKLCGSEGYSKDFPPIAENEFLKSANAPINISQLDNDWVKVIIDSPIKTHYPRTWYLHREAQTWKVSGGSFIIGNCTCG